MFAPAADTRTVSEQHADNLRNPLNVFTGSVSSERTSSVLCSKCQGIKGTVPPLPHGWQEFVQKGALPTHFFHEVRQARHVSK